MRKQRADPPDKNEILVLLVLSIAMLAMVKWI